MCMITSELTDAIGLICGKLSSSQRALDRSARCLCALLLCDRQAGHEPNVWTRPATVHRCHTQTASACIITKCAYIHTTQQQMLPLAQLQQYRHYTKRAAASTAAATDGADACAHHCRNHCYAANSTGWVDPQLLRAGAFADHCLDHCCAIYIYDISK